MDPVDAWSDAAARVTELCLSLDDAAWAVHVPACPDWTVKDLVAHMVGLGADVLAGDEPDDHDPAWTQAQVDARSDRTGPAVLAEWASLAPDLVAWMREHGSRPLNDVVIHEHDLRSAVGRPGGRESEGLLLVRERMAQRFAKAVVALPGIALVGDEWTWSSREGEPAVELRADDFDLFRALTSRRTADQLRSYAVRGDVAPYLDAFAGLGPLPEHPLPE